MKNVYLVCGYGIPKNILKDENYNFYLKIIFNHIFDRNLLNPIVIFSGGKTDLNKPYKKTEAEEMSRLFVKLQNRSFLKRRTHGWHLFNERQSLSTVGNLLLTKKMLKNKNLKPYLITIFCEKTKKQRVTELAENIYGKSLKKVEAIDFDISKNRYDDIIKEVEKNQILFDLWALKSKQNLKQHNKQCKEKLKFFKKAIKEGRSNFIKQWWLIHLQKSKALMK